MQPELIVPSPREILSAKEYNDYILDYCNTRQLFEAHWDPYQFDWENRSLRLCSDRPSLIDIWWHREFFNWNSAATYLIESCKDYSKIWWTDDIWSRVIGEAQRIQVSLRLIPHFHTKFDIWWQEKLLSAPAVSKSLASNYNYKFNRWFNKHLIPQYDASVLDSLLKHRIRNFEEWYHPAQYITHKHWDLIQQWAQKYKRIWEADYVAFRLSN